MGSFSADPGSSTVARARETGKHEAFSGSRSSDFPFPIAKAFANMFANEEIKSSK